MVIKMALAFLLAYAFAVGFGKFFIPWLKKHSYSQPIKDEVARIYAEKETEQKEEHLSGCDR